MKTIFTYLLSFSILPVALSAQPTLTKNEYYETGEVIQMVNCSPAQAIAGPAAADTTWNFSTLTASGGYSITTILHDTSTSFGTSNLMYLMPDGTIQFVQENNTDSYVNGIYDTTSHITTYYNNYDIAKRPASYDVSYIDSYKVNGPGGEYGTGILVQTGDAYGTLVLPGGTYTNVLRVKKTNSVYDTVGSADYYSLTTSYLWFDTSDRPPLLEIDSVSNITGTYQKIMYLPPATGISYFNSEAQNYTGYLDNNGQLQINGFENNKEYSVNVYNIIGNKVFTQDFIASDNVERFDIGRQLPPGIYPVSIVLKNATYASTSVIKVVKSN